MREKFVFLSKVSDIKTAKAEGAAGVFVKMPLKSAEEVKKAAECGLKVWIIADYSEETEVKYLLDFAGRVKCEAKICKSVTESSFEKLIADVSCVLEFVEGFIINTPMFEKPIWDDSIGNIEDLYILFDEYTDVSPVRSWYYERAEQYIISQYFEPIYSLAKKIDKRVSFDIGQGDIQYDFMIRMLNPVRLISEGFSVTVKKETAEIVSMLELSKSGCFIIDEFKYEGIKVINNTKEEKILLIKPTRGITERYAVLQKKLSVRMETPATVAAVEGVYYSTKLLEKGYEAVGIDEFILENSAYCENGKLVVLGENFDKVIVCDSCLFLEKGRDILKDAYEIGIHINDKELILQLAEENLEDKS